MTNTTFREYKFKFYLNANHFIVINGKEGEVHSAAFSAARRETVRIVPSVGFMTAL